MKNLEPYIAELKKLHDQIPSFKCIKGCTDCCGPVFMTELELSLIGFQRIPHSTKCPYAQKGGCSIYDRRPIICRLFGVVNDKFLTCSFGKGPALKLDNDTSRWILTKSQLISAKAGYPKVIQTHEDFYRQVSPSRIPIQLKGYNFI